ncbi:hypothetical protein [Coraliomargarita parva]|uniref:hypothetical protein n=1 Tax=Coraliomargarita parva TaxID=3014050 RepID=UPI0022B48177|nr:hypothetical protein [Coraliomargarita parva]
MLISMYSFIFGIPILILILLWIWIRAEVKTYGSGNRLFLGFFVFCMIVIYFLGYINFEARGRRAMQKLELIQIVRILNELDLMQVRIALDNIKSGVDSGEIKTMGDVRKQLLNEIQPTETGQPTHDE